MKDDKVIKGKFNMRNLNQRLVLTPKVIYFAIGMVYYAFYVYRMKFFRQYFKLEEDKAGIVQAVWNVASIIGVTGWSNLGDVLGAHRGLLIFLCLAMAGVFELTLIRNFLPAELWFYLAMIVFGIFGFVSAGVMPLTDFQVLKLLSEVFNTDETIYGRQVLFGTIAYGFITYGLGALIDKYGVGVLFWVMPMVSTFSASLVWMFGISGDKRQSEKALGQIDSTTIPALNSTSFKTYLQTLGQPRFLFFLVVILSIGVGRQVLNIFLPHYLEQELHLSEKQIGWAYLGSSLFSVTFLASGPYILQSLGVRPMLLAGLGALVARLGGYAILKPGPTCPWKVMAIELLNGISFSFTHLGGVREAAACAPPGWEAIFQAAYTAAYVQVPAVFVSLIGGYLYKFHGGYALFIHTTILSFCAFVLLFIIVVFTSPSRGGQSTRQIISKA